MRVLKLLKLLAIAGGTAIASSALAAPVVTTWNYTVTTVFTTCTFTNGTGTVGGSTPPDTTCSANNVAWGTNGANIPQPFVQSSLEITGPGPGGAASGSVNTTSTDNNPIVSPCHGPAPGSNVACPNGSEIAPTQTFTHHNNPIYDPLLTQATVQGSLLLTPTAPSGGPPFGPVTVNFTIHFAETLNSPPCTAPSPPGNPCNDIFAIEGGLNAFPFDYALPGGTPEHYFVTIVPNPLNPLTPLTTLTPAECAAANTTFPCSGFTTPEGQDSAVQFAFFITTTPFSLIPEPGVLALFALGLVALGFTVQRRKA